MKSENLKQLEKAYSQEKNLSERLNMLRILSDPHKNINEEKALSYSKKAIELSKEYEDVVFFKILEIYCLDALSKVEEGIVKCHSLLADIVEKDIISKLKTIDYLLSLNIKKGDYETVISYREMIKNIIAENEDQSTFIAAINMNIGIAYASTGNVEMAVELFLLTKNEYEKEGYTIGIFQILYNISILYSNYKNYDVSLKYLNQALEFAITINNPKSLSMVYEALASVYADKKEKALSKKNILKAIEFAEQFPFRKNHILINYAKLLIDDKELEKFFEIENQILENPSFLEMQVEYATNFYSTAAEAYLLAKNFKKAVSYLKKASKDSMNKKDIESQLRILQLKVKIFEKTNDFKKALNAHKKYLKLYSEKVSESKHRVINELEVKYENEKKEREIENLKLQKTTFQLQSLRSQMNPHFVFNTINSISSQMTSNTLDKSVDLLNSFARLMRSNLEFAEQEKITLEEEIKFLTDYLSLEQNGIGEKLAFEIKYPKNMDLDFIEIPSMILQPYIENAIKHGIKPLEKKGKISVIFQENDEHLVCTIKDNGIGRKAAASRKEKKEKHLGKSTKITQTRLDLLGHKNPELVKVHYTDLYDKAQQPMGTEVEIRIQL